MDTEYKNCPYCGERILKEAKKCQHCGEWLNAKAKKEAEQRAAAKHEAEQAVKEQERKKENAQAMTIGIGCGLLLWIMIIGGLSYIIHCTVPSEERMERAIVENVQECVEEKVTSVAGFFGKEAGGIASFLFATGAPAENISKTFYHYNDITIESKWLWSIGKISNRNTNAKGNTVCFGMLGIVIPFVEWEDFVLSEED